jgi:hypothetical protein
VQRLVAVGPLRSGARKHRASPSTIAKDPRALVNETRAERPRPAGSAPGSDASLKSHALMGARGFLTLRHTGRGRGSDKPTCRGVQRAVGPALAVPGAEGSEGAVSLRTTAAHPRARLEPISLPAAGAAGLDAPPLAGSRGWHGRPAGFALGVRTLLWHHPRRHGPRHSHRGGRCRRLPAMSPAITMNIGAARSIAIGAQRGRCATSPAQDKTRPRMMRTGVGCKSVASRLQNTCNMTAWEPVHSGWPIVG